MLNLNDSKFYHQFPAFNKAREVAELCQPLFQMIKANYFDYNRIYHDSSFLSLSSDAYWLEHFFKKKYKLCTAYQRTGMHLWDSYYYQEATHDAAVNFNHAHGISIIYQNEKYIEYVDIAASRENREITSFYLNYPDLINNFVMKFKNYADSLILVAEKNRVTLSEKITSATDSFESFHLLTKNQLTPRELQCFKHYINGKTAKETAEILNLSNRTIEEYIDNLKRKLKCRYKRDLLKYLHIIS